MSLSFSVLEEKSQADNITKPDTPPAKATHWWWWPYLNPTVMTVTLLLTFIGVLFGMASAITSASNGTDAGWKQWLESQNLNYDFIWSELTTGEGSLFWNIAVNGYAFEPKNIAKFPLYPMTVRCVWELTGRSVSVSLLLWLIHQLMVWAGVAETYRFWENYHRGYGARAVFWLISSPLITLHVWLFDFIEPGFIALVWLCLTLERNQRWISSSISLLALTMLQPSGIILAAFIGVRRLWRWYRTEIPGGAVLWVVLPGAMWLGWMTLSSIQFDRFLAPYAFQYEWGRDDFLWPWERWARYIRYAMEVEFQWAHVITSVSLAWITLGYGWGARLWLKLRSSQKHLLGGTWAFPLFSFVIVVIPFSTAVYGANRYALTTLLGVWPLLFHDEVQSSRVFRRYERAIWIVFLAVNLFVSFTIVTEYGKTWNIYYWP